MPQRTTRKETNSRSVDSPGGFDYTGADCEGWMNDAGFASTSVTPLVGPASMVVGIK